MFFSFYVLRSVPVDKATFLHHVWASFKMLQEKANDDAGKPAYFRFLTLLGFRIFLETQVDVAILEVGLGGRLDATNCVRNPVVCGVTPLGFDHMDLLGYTLPEIAREKAGIFKPGHPAFTAPQREDAAAALEEVAARVGTPLSSVKPFSEYKVLGSEKSVDEVQIGLAGAHQRENAALAVVLAAEWEATSGRGGAGAQERAEAVRRGELPPEYLAGLQAARWPGRGQIVQYPLDEEESSLDASESRLTFFLDGAHTAESMATCGRWFADAVEEVPERPDMQTHSVLVFNCMQERDPSALLQPLIATLSSRDALPPHALFVPPDSTYMKLGKVDETPDLAWQLNLRQVWDRMHTSTSQLSNGTASSTGNGTTCLGVQGAKIKSVPRLPPLPAVAAVGVPAVQDIAAGAVLPSLQHTLEWLKRCVKETPSMRMHVLVTGSLYLVGDMLRLLGKSTSGTGHGGPPGSKTGGT